MMKKLFSTTCIPTETGYKKSPFFRQFVQGEDGNVTVMSLFFIAVLMMLAGISWDVNSHEYHRVKIQGTADRAVLAAADLDQTMDPEVVVKDYFEKVGYPDLVSTVNISEGLNFRTVSVLADAIVDVNSINGDVKTNAYMGGRALNDALKSAEDRIAEERPSDEGMTDDEIRDQELENAQLIHATNLTNERIAEINDEWWEATENGTDTSEFMKYNGLTYDELFEMVKAEVMAEAIEKTNFVKLRAMAEAEERVNNVEISMVLDISGSMGEGNKMSNLRDAARTFVDAVINESTQDLVSVSIVPYSEHVSAGPDIMNELNVDVNNPYSHCIEFSESDFDTARLRRDKQYDQVQHFQWGYNGRDNDRSKPVCPIGTHEDVVAFSQDVSALKYKIGQLVPRGSTSIFAGMKWAAGLLDPDFNTINTALINNGAADPAFAARPAAYDDYETLKTVVLMTDGQNHYSYRINDNYYANYSHAAHWNRYNLNWYLSRYVNSWQHNQFKYLKYWPDYGDSLLSNVCDAAKEKNIVIWSIGFEVSDHGANVMRDCASSPSHFFRVEGVEIKEAFKAIARQINQLRLTQ